MTHEQRQVTCQNQGPLTVATLSLSLESPCLGHIHGDPATPTQPSGHALTITSHLLAMAPPTSPSQVPQDTATTLSQARADAPTEILDRLLSLSADLAAEGEVTPVQAWNRICREPPQLKWLGVHGLRWLMDKLTSAVKCHG